MQKLEFVEAVLKKISQWFNWVALVALLLMVALVAADITAGKLFNRPFVGGVELVCFIGVVIVSFSISQTYALGRHIRVDFIVLRLPERIRLVLISLSALISFLFFVVVVWRVTLYAYDMQVANEVSATYRIPFMPFIYGIALASIPITLLLAVEFIKSIGGILKK